MNPLLRYRKGYKYQTAEDYALQTELRPEKRISTDWIALDTDGQILIKKGYAWDGASGPTINTLSSIIPSLIHDALYQLIREGHLAQEFRGQVDSELYRLCLEDGMLKIRAIYWFEAVRIFGCFVLTSGEILTAPQNLP